MGYLLLLYNAHVRSRLDHGAPVYGSARPSNLKIMDRANHVGLRLAIRTSRTSPTASLFVDTGQMSPEKLRCCLGFSRFFRLNSIRSHLANRCLQNSSIARLFENKPIIIKPLSMQLQGTEILPQIHVQPANMLQFPYHSSPWNNREIGCLHSFEAQYTHCLSYCDFESLF